MHKVIIIATKEIRTALRSKLFLTITLLFLGLSILSVSIGSVTKEAEMRIYNETVASLQAAGSSAIPNPPEIHTLTILSNLTEYVAIVGAILAIVLGYNSIISEKEAACLPLILSRPIYRDQVFTGKWLGNAGLIAALLIFVFLFNLILLILISGLMPTLAQVLRLLGLVGLAYLYMLIFLSFSMLLSTRLNNAATAFLVSLVFWLLLSFVIPQMADTQMLNSSVVNSINGVIKLIPQETTVSRSINFLSPTWHLRQIGKELLEVSPGSAALDAMNLVGDGLRSAFILFIPSLIFIVLSYAFFLRDDTLTLG
jgi:ABC-2 type transport system permease protein